MDIEDKDVKVKMSICPKCGNAITIAIEHKMTTKTKKAFAKDVMDYNLNVQIISLDEYQTSNIKMFCEESCDHMKQKS